MDQLHFKFPNIFNFCIFFKVFQILEDYINFFKKKLSEIYFLNWQNTWFENSWSKSVLSLVEFQKVWLGL